MKIRDILRQETGVAFEFFPPKNEASELSLFEHLKVLEGIDPAYVSVTYGAGGSSRANTSRIVRRIAEEEKLTVMAHLTCVGHTRAEIETIVAEYHESGIENIMALRGDTPRGTNINPADGELPHAIDLVRLIRKIYGDGFSIGIAAFPEKHLESPDWDCEISRFKEKVDAGVDFAVTQMYFDNEFFYRYIERARKAGIAIPIIPGIMPLTNYKQIETFNTLSGAVMPKELIGAVEKAAGDEQAVYKIGVDFAVRQCLDLIAHGHKFLHFFTLNKSNASLDIYNAIRSSLQ
ncbi:MAG: methylenetetrahydrofolate reductase [NAD(P)H] [Spirochaetes bacterium GWF1_51_8]|nr:MAG: methylenetetrahydrofolate reductase [NAD(P)H] [Spirochaetes bacterium GWF1_51_8]